MPEWVSTVRDTFEGEPWCSRVEWRHDDVVPEGPRTVEKTPPVWTGPAFDLAFVDGPRSAHPTSYGRHGSFAFALKYVRDGGIIIWHDNDRQHERTMAKQYLGRFWLHYAGRLGWYVKRPVPFGLKCLNLHLPARGGE